MAHLIAVCQAVGQLHPSFSLLYLDHSLPNHKESIALLRAFGALPISLPNSHRTLGNSIGRGTCLVTGALRGLKSLWSNQDLPMSLLRKGMIYGDLAYDTALRFQQGSTVFPTLSLLSKHVIYRQYEALCLGDVYASLLTHTRINLMISSDRCYNIDGIAVRACLSRAIPCLLLWDMRYIELLTSYETALEDPRSRGVTTFVEHATAEDLRMAEAYLTRRFSADLSIDKEAVVAFSTPAYSSARTGAATALCDHDGPIVLIASHCFTDFPHLTGKQAFRDYYQWLKHTLQFSMRLRHIKWIVREHPMSPRYRECGIVESLCAEFPHVHFVSTEVDMGTLLSKVDAVVTVRGTVGMEAVIHGCKVICSATSVYSDLNIATTCTEQTQYFSELQRITKGKHFEPVAMRKASLALYYLFYHAPISSTLEIEIQSALKSPLTFEINHNDECIRVLHRFITSNLLSTDPLVLRARHTLSQMLPL